MIIIGHCKITTGCFLEAKNLRKKYARDHNVPDPTFHYIDTRRRLVDIAAALDKLEGRVWGEGISVSPLVRDRGILFPSDWDMTRLKIYCTTGGSEGIYLHVDAVINSVDINLFLGKTLHASMAACYESAGRIAEWLNA